MPLRCRRGCFMTHMLLFLLDHDAHGEIARKTCGSMR